MPEPERVVVRPRPLSSILFILASSPLWGLGFVALLKGFWLLGGGLIAACALVWLVMIGGVSIVADGETVELHRLFWTEWQLRPQRLLVHRRFGGELLPAYLLVDERGTFGTIVKVPFDPMALRGLISLLLSRGAILR